MLSLRGITLLSFIGVSSLMLTAERPNSTDPTFVLPESLLISRYITVLGSTSVFIWPRVNVDIRDLSHDETSRIILEAPHLWSLCLSSANSGPSCSPLLGGSVPRLMTAVCGGFSVIRHSALGFNAWLQMGTSVAGLSETGAASVRVGETRFFVHPAPRNGVRESNFGEVVFRIGRLIMFVS